jgi:hypothetical protein
MHCLEEMLRMFENIRWQLIGYNVRTAYLNLRMRYRFEGQLAKYTPSRHTNAGVAHRGTPIRPECCGA